MKQHLMAGDLIGAGRTGHRTKIWRDDEWLLITGISRVGDEITIYAQDAWLTSYRLAYYAQDEVIVK